MGYLKGLMERQGNICCLIWLVKKSRCGWKGNLPKITGGIKLADGFDSMGELYKKSRTKEKDRL